MALMPAVLGMALRRGFNSILKTGLRGSER